VENDNGKLTVLGIYKFGTNAAMDKMLGVVNIAQADTDSSKAVDGSKADFSHPIEGMWKSIRQTNLANAAIEQGGPAIKDMLQKWGPSSEDGKPSAQRWGMDGEQASALRTAEKANPEIAALEANPQHAAAFIAVPRELAPDGGVYTQTDYMGGNRTISITLYNLDKAREFDESHHSPAFGHMDNLAVVLSHEFGHVIAERNAYLAGIAGTKAAERDGYVRSITMENNTRSLLGFSPPRTYHNNPGDTPLR
jgi:hypothetical protein